MTRQEFFDKYLNGTYLIIENTLSNYDCLKPIVDEFKLNVQLYHLTSCRSLLTFDNKKFGVQDRKEIYLFELLLAFDFIERPIKEKLFLGVSKQADLKLRGKTKETLKGKYEVEEWDEHLGVSVNLDKIKECEKLYLILPNNFDESRIIGRGLCAEIDAFLSKHSLDQVYGLFYSGERYKSRPVKNYYKFKDFESYDKCGTLIF